MVINNREKRKAVDNVIKLFRHFTINCTRWSSSFC